MSADKTVLSATPMQWPIYKKYVIGVLLVVYTFNFIDRQIIAILSPAIQADLGINDTQLGFLKGFAFAVVYSAFSIPIALLADEKNRVTIISVSIALWSTMTALCGAILCFYVTYLRCWTRLCLSAKSIPIENASLFFCDFRTWSYDYWTWFRACLSWVSFRRFRHEIRRSFWIA